MVKASMFMVFVLRDSSGSHARTSGPLLCKQRKTTSNQNHQLFDSNHCFGQCKGHRFARHERNQIKSHFVFGSICAIPFFLFPSLCKFPPFLTIGT